MKKKILGLISGTMIAAMVIAPIASTTTVQAAQKGWVYNSAQKAYNYYGTNGKKYTGWHYMTKKEGENKDHWNYFGSDGRLYTGWKYMSKAEGEKTPHWSYFGSNGWLRTGWIQLGKGTSEPDGNTAKHWSYFGSNGWLRTGWVQLGKGTSEPDGNTAKHWSYFGENGWLRTGWVQLGKGTSEPDGNSAKHYSYFGTNGWLRTGMQDMSTAANPDGGAAKHKSYFGDNGWLVVNRDFTYKSKDYQADSKGWVTERKATTTAKTTEAPKPTRPKPTQTVKPTEAPKPTQTVKPTETPKPTQPKPTQPKATTHQHNWQAVYKTVHHPAITHQEKYTEKEPYTYTVEEPYTYTTYVKGWEIYEDCTSDFTSLKKVKTLEECMDAFDNYINAGNLSVGCYGYTSCSIPETATDYETVTKTGYKDVVKTRTVVDKEAYDEKVVDYYKCNCGETKR